ncbi:MAG: rod shape-determining protein MreC [Patescibacteria group bacterium]|nr:rod shape-determining protein MreC [Patescibacteria group bacterium]MDD5490451.1 rod shape-determining protein MreC [Patescibacteria group bacterium]
MQRSRSKYYFIFVAVLLLLVFLYYIGGLHFIGGAITKTLNPLLGEFYSGGNWLENFYSDKTGNRAEISSLLAKNKELGENYSKLLKENAELKVLVNENESLKKELKFSEERKYRIIPGRVISRNLFLPNTLIIDKGEEDGLRKGLAVVADEGVIIGKIIKIEKSISTILLLTDVQSKLAVMSLDDQGINGMVSGEYGLSLKMELIPKDKELRSEGIVVTSGIETDIPPGLLVGRISQITNLSGELFQSAVLSPLTNYHNIKFVLVLLP